MRYLVLLLFTVSLGAEPFCEYPKTCTASTNVLLRVCPQQGCHLDWDWDTREYEFGWTTLKGQRYHLWFNPVQGYVVKLLEIHGDHVCKFNPPEAGVWGVDPERPIEGWALVAIESQDWQVPAGPNLNPNGIVYRQYPIAEYSPGRVEIHKYNITDDEAYLYNNEIIIKTALFNVTSNHKMVQCEFSGEFVYSYVPVVE